MPPEDHKTQKKIQCWIPLDTWEKVVSLGYTSPTIAVTEAFKKLLEDPRASLENPKNIPNTSPMDPLESPDIPGYKAMIEEAQRQIKDMEESLRKAPDLAEFSRMQARSEELEKHNYTLKGELEKAHLDKDNIRNLYDNYMRQMQTLIQQKAIEAPDAEKKKPWYKFW
jgi:hypothetical protein